MLLWSRLYPCAEFDPPHLRYPDGRWGIYAHGAP